MVNHHPDARLLNEFSSGTLPLAQSICVSLHLNYCEHCQRSHRKLQQLGATMFEELAPEQVDDSLLQSVLSRLDEDPPLSHSKHDVKGQYPGLMHRLMSGKYDDLEWKSVGSALNISHLQPGDQGHELSLYHIKAGMNVPRHTHRGTELTLVLEGSFSDEEGVYQVGDFLIRDEEHVHTPTASKAGDCICVSVLDAPIRFTGWNYRLLNPFLKLHAS
jgi:putative transcriptional regulator